MSSRVLPPKLYPVDVQKVCSLLIFKTSNYPLKPWRLGCYDYFSYNNFIVINVDLYNHCNTHMALMLNLIIYLFVLIPNYEFMKLCATWSLWTGMAYMFCKHINQWTNNLALGFPTSTILDLLNGSDLRVPD